MKRRLLTILVFVLALVLAVPAWSQLSTSTVSGVVYDAIGSPLPKTTILFNVPKQVISKQVVAQSLVSAITDANGAISLNLPRRAIVQVTISTGMPIAGVVPNAPTSTFAEVISRTNLDPLPPLVLASQGGTGLDTSSSSGIAVITAGVWSVGNLTGPITSSGLTTSVGAQTGTGSTFVMQTSPTLITPVIGAATGTSLSLSGAISASNLSGTNTGDQTITLTGGVTGSGTGSFAATVITNANLTGEVTSVGNAATLTNSAVIAKVLTGYVSGAGTVAATDSILQAIQKLDGNIATAGTLETGTWSSPSRGVNTVFQNTSGRKRRVTGSVTGTDAADYALIEVGSTNPPTLTLSKLGAIGFVPFSFEVPNNWYYRIGVIGVAPTIDFGNELDK